MLEGRCSIIKFKKIFSGLLARYAILRHLMMIEANHKMADGNVFHTQRSQKLLPRH